MGSYPSNFRFCSGLSAAYRLRSEGVAVTVFETQDSVGGKIQSYSRDGLIWEKGPNTMVWKQALSLSVIGSVLNFCN